MTRRSTLVTVAFFSVANGALAFCTKPDAPFCASRYDNFHDKHDFENCKREMELDKIKFENFTSCLKRGMQ